MNYWEGKMIKFLRKLLGLCDNELQKKIDELLKENEKLKQENKEGFALLDRSMTGWRNSQELSIKLAVDVVNLRDEVDLAIETLRHYARSSDPELAKETLIKLNASL